jgi:polyisoprenoid-binding protein YceI
MKQIVSLLVGALFPLIASAADSYVIDKVHSTVGFKIRHFFSKVTGRFTDFAGTLQLDEKNPEESSVEVTIQAASIDTDNDQRDEHLRSKDFFDVEKFPTLSFKSTSVKRTGENTADVAGSLTIHGVTKEAVLKVEFLGKGSGMKGSIVSGWNGTTALKRSDYGLTWNNVVEGKQVVGDDVQIELHIEAVKK